MGSAQMGRTQGAEHRFYIGKTKAGRTQLGRKQKDRAQSGRTQCEGHRRARCGGTGRTQGAVHR